MNFGMFLLMAVVFVLIFYLVGFVYAYVVVTKVGMKYYNKLIEDVMNDGVIEDRSDIYNELYIQEDEAE